MGLAHNLQSKTAVKRPYLLILILMLAAGAATASFFVALGQKSTAMARPNLALPALAEPSTQGPFERYLLNDIPPAHGFDFPLGDADGHGSYIDVRSGREHQGYYVALSFGESFALGLHPGEDWNGRGGGNTDLGQPVHAVATGRVVVAAAFEQPFGGIVILQHSFYENHEKKALRSVYIHLDELRVEVGEIVARRQIIGKVGRDPQRLYLAHLHFELRSNFALSPTFWPSSHSKGLPWLRDHYLPPSQFIRSHRRLFVPPAEAHLLLVDHEHHRMRHVRGGETKGEYEISLGHKEGRKRRLGDNRTPKGMYFVTGKHRGAFGGDYAEYYGGHWIKISYPNAFDAAWGLDHGLINDATADAMATSWRERALPYQASPLGKGIGFHGWNSEWSNDGPRQLSFGCVVMHNTDIAALYDQIPVGSMVVIF